MVLIASKADGFPVAMTPDVDLGFDGAYAVYLKEQWVRYSVVSAAISIVLVPVFAVLDWLVYPQWFGAFLVLRIVCAAIVAVLVAATVRWYSSVLPPVTILSLILIQVMIAYMVWVTDGQYSGYYAGLNLPIIGMGFFLPTEFTQTLIFCLLSLFLYTFACTVGATGPLGIPFVEHTFFIVSTGVIATYSTWFLKRRRKTEFTLAFELEARIRELDYLNRKRSDFFSNVSHELRTPLTLILAPVQEILSGATRLPDALAGRLMVVRDNGLRLLKLVNELLDLIRLEENVDGLEIRPVDINRMLRALVDSMSHLADAKGVHLERDLKDDPLVIEGDSRAVEKIFVNLIGNAVKFTEPGGRVTVASRVDGDLVRVAVQDDGIGIAKSDQGHIFERFRQADSSATRRHRGTGLGLALVKEMTERMGGSVMVDSELGLGTTMTVCFKRTELPAESDESAEILDALEAIHRMAERQGGLPIEHPQELTGSLAPPLRGDKPSVLVVEDEPDMRRYLVEVLEAEYQVLQARDGREGLDLALARDPDLILLDLMLPEMDGLEVCRRIRSDAQARPSRIMLLTARADEQSKLSALENGANDFLTKPFSTVEVLTRLRNLLENARLERDLAARNARLEQTLRDLESTQAQLIQSEKLNALGSLSAGLLHEINNPLNYSLTALQLLGADPAIQNDELMREIVTDIDEGMQRIRAIVSDLRAFAYPSEAQKQGVFDLNEAVEAALRFTSHDLHAIAVGRDLPTPAWVLGSKSHLTQVLINLLTNAAKAIAAVGGGHEGRIGIAAESLDGRLRVSVQDNGTGMDQSVLARIFDPFFTTREVGEGMGLGLSVCHTIIANHHGRLTASSRVGEGSTLSFDLPLPDLEPS